MKDSKVLETLFLQHNPISGPYYNHKETNQLICKANYQLTCFYMSIIRNNLNWLYADDEVKKLFSPGPMVSFLRKKREDYWIQTLKTAAPWGLNIM